MVARRFGWGLGVALTCVGLFLAPAALAAQRPVGDFTPGVVEPPAPGHELHGDVVMAPRALAFSSALQGSGDSQRIPTADGYTVTVETSPFYEADVPYDEELVAFLDSLLHGRELENLFVYVAPPSEMKAICGGRAAACYLPLDDQITIVGEAGYGGIPTSYAVAHEYGHRIEQYRRNPPFEGSAFFWGTKRWASVKHVCQGAISGRFAPGDEGKRYFDNPGEAFAESFAAYHFGHPFGGWRWDPRLHPTPAAYAALRADVLNPWRPVHSERRGFLGRRGVERVYTLRPRYDGWVQARMTGSSDLDLYLVDKRNHVVAYSVRDGTSNEKINYVDCGQRKLKLVVYAYRPHGRFQLKLTTP
jgi:hypothetical protein